MSPPRLISVLFVGTDDVCRSAAALALAEAEVRRRGFRGCRLDSAGTTWRHVGRPAPPEVVAQGLSRGLSMNHRARRVHPGDLASFDLLVAMDQAIAAEIERLRGGMELRSTFHIIQEPQQVQLLRRWDPFAMPGDEDVHRPDVLGPDEVREMFETVERCVGPLCDRLEELAAAVS